MNLILEVPEWLMKSINKGLQGKRLPVNKALRAINEINRQIKLQQNTQDGSVSKLHSVSDAGNA
jgi:hypothetical protein